MRDRVPSLLQKTLIINTLPIAYRGEWRSTSLLLLHKNRLPSTISAAWPWLVMDVLTGEIAKEAAKGLDLLAGY
jgi:hypothetical protein